MAVWERQRDSPRGMEQRQGHPPLWPRIALPRPRGACRHRSAVRARGPASGTDAPLTVSILSSSNYEERLRYPDWASEQLDKEGRRGHAGLIVMCSFLQFLKMYVLRGGFLDGMHGFVLAYLHAFYVASKYVRLWERQLPAHSRAGVHNQGVASKSTESNLNTTS